MRGAVHAHIGNLCDPVAQLLVEIGQISVGAPQHEIALDVLHPGFDLAFGLVVIGAAHPGFEIPMLGELEERPNPTHWQDNPEATQN